MGLRTEPTRTADRDEAVVYGLVGRLRPSPENWRGSRRGRGFDFSDGKSRWRWPDARCWLNPAQTLNRSCGRKHLAQYDRLSPARSRILSAARGVRY